MFNFRALAFIAATCLPLTVFAQDEPEVTNDDPKEEVVGFKAVPDRPLYGAAPVTVEKGHGQLEVGAEFSTVGDASQLAFPILARIGVADYFELRAGLPAVIVPLSDETSTVGAIQLGGKFGGEVSELLSIAALPYFDIAVGTGDETSFSQSTYGIRLLWELDFVDAFGLQGTFGAAVGPSLEPGDGPRALSVSASLAAVLDLGDLGVAAEGFTYLVHDTPVVGGRVAVSYALFDTFVLDLSGGTSSLTEPLPGLLPDGVTGFVGLGLTVAR